MEKYVVGIGELLWDMLPAGKQLGGAPANFAYHVSRLGLDGLAVSAVGADPLGDEALASLRERGLRCLVARTGRPTGTVQVSLDAAGVPQYEIKTGVAWDNIPFTAELAEVAASARAVCFGSLAQRSPVSRETIYRFLDTVPAECLKVFDINLRQHFYSREVLEESLRRADILKINDEEILTLASLSGLCPSSGPNPVSTSSPGPTSSSALPSSGTNPVPTSSPGPTTSSALPSSGQAAGLSAIETLVALGESIRKEYSLQMLVLTCGAVGSYVFSREGVSYLDTPKVEVVDTVGAGDSFTAAFVASLLQGGSIAEAHRRAVDVAAFVCTRPGAMPSD